jgi:rubredoxin
MFITAFSKPKYVKGKAVNSTKAAQEKFIDLLQLSCHICASSYDAIEKIPIILCPEQHTYCLICVKKLFNDKPNAHRCPSCRVSVTKNATYTNKTLLRLCDLVPAIAIEFANLTK